MRLTFGVLIIIALTACVTGPDSMAPSLTADIELDYSDGFPAGFSEVEVYPLNAESDIVNHPFPRLAMWWPSSWEQSSRELARYDWIGWGPWDDRAKLEKLKRMNPGQLHFMSATITETSWYQFGEYDTKGVSSQIPAEWFLTSKGSQLAENISKTATRIPVSQIRDSKGELLFQKGDTLVCEYESMLVKDVDEAAGVLIVNRGHFRPAAEHQAGTRIAPHVTFWPESWVMNLSNECPEVEMDGKFYKWNEWSVKHYLPIEFPLDFDGYILDRLEEGQSWLVGGYTRSISPDFTNRFISDYSDFDASWDAGVDNALLLFERLYPDQSIIANSFGMHYKNLDGSIYEAMPTNWDDNRPLTYKEWAHEGRPFMLGEEGYINVSKQGIPNFSFAETYEVSEWYDNAELEKIVKRDPDLRHMRFGLTSALLGDGYYSFEASTQGHGALRLYWFPEYDDAGRGRGYLGYPAGNAFELLIGVPEGKSQFNSQAVWGRWFENGFVICNPTDTAFEILLPKDMRLPGSDELVDRIIIAPRDGRIFIQIP